MNTLGMANLNAQLLALQIAAAGGRFGQPGLAGLGGIGGFVGLQGGWQGGFLGTADGPQSIRRASTPRQVWFIHHPPQESTAAGINGGSGSAKKDEEDFGPAVLNDVATWLRSLRLHNYTPNFEGMTWKEMLLMDEQAFETQDVAALGARKKVLKTFEVVRKKMGSDRVTAPTAALGAPPPSSASTLGCSTGSGGGIPSV